MSNSLLILVTFLFIYFNLHFYFISHSPLTLYFFFWYRFFFSHCLLESLSLHHIRWSSGEEDRSKWSIHIISNLAYFLLISHLFSYGLLSYNNRVSSGLKTDQSISLLDPLPFQSHHFLLDFISVSACCLLNACVTKFLLSVPSVSVPFTLSLWSSW